MLQCCKGYKIYDLYKLLKPLQALETLVSYFNLLAKKSINKTIKNPDKLIKIANKTSFDHKGKMFFWINGCISQCLSKKVETVCFHGQILFKDHNINQIKIITIWSCHLALTQWSNFANDKSQIMAHQINIKIGIIAFRFHSTIATTFHRTSWYCHKIKRI